MSRTPTPLRERILIILQRVNRPCTRGELMGLGCHRSKKGETAEDVQMALDELTKDGIVRAVRPFQSLRGPSARIAWELNDEPATKELPPETNEGVLSDMEPIRELIPPPGCQWEEGIVLTIPEYTVLDESGKISEVIPKHTTPPTAGWRDPTVKRTNYTEQGNTHFNIARQGQKMRKARMERIMRTKPDDTI